MDACVISFFSSFFFRSTLPLSQEDYEVIKSLFPDASKPLVDKICSIAQLLVYIPEVESMEWSV